MEKFRLEANADFEAENLEEAFIKLAGHFFSLTGDKDVKDPIENTEGKIVVKQVNGE